MPEGIDAAASLAVPYAEVCRRELSLIAARNYVPDDFREAMRLIANGAVDVEPMVTGLQRTSFFVDHRDALPWSDRRSFGIIGATPNV